MIPREYDPAPEQPEPRRRAARLEARLRANRSLQAINAMWENLVADIQSHSLWGAVLCDATLAPRVSMRMHWACPYTCPSSLARQWSSEAPCWG